MLGAEGVKRAVIGRLQATMPVALGVRRHVTGATVFDLPEVKRFYPTTEITAATYQFPLCTVTAEGTNGELSNQRGRVGAVVEEFEFEYTILVRLHALVDSQAGGPAARLQAERLALAAREALLGDTELDAPGEDEATVVFERWAEEYEVAGDPDAGVWEAVCTLQVPVATVEHLDRGPYIAARQAVLKTWDVEQVPASTAFPASPTS